MAGCVSDESFAEYVKQAGLAAHAQVEEAQAMRAGSAARGTTISLAEALVMMGFITAKQLATEERGVLKQLGQYKVIKKLGDGGMGAVYLAEDVLVGRHVAIKVLARKYSENPEFLARFRREMRAAGKLKHPNVMGIHAAGEEMGYHFFVMEYGDGESLDKILKRDHFLPWGNALNVATQVARGLKHAHDKGILHRDVKPGNMFVTTDGTVKIMDLGLSKDFHEARPTFETQAGVALGTPHYISPEQARGDKEIDGRADIYSLGATLYHLVTGQTPFQGSSAAVIMLKHLNAEVPDPRTVKPELPEVAARIIQRMMAKNTEERYGNCDDLLKALERAAGNSYSDELLHGLERAAGGGDSVDGTVDAPQDSASTVIPRGKPRHAPASASRSPSGSTLSRLASMPFQDLSSDKLLLSAPQLAYDAGTVPSLGGIPLLAKLGQGSMGAVYYGIHPRLEHEVAVKVLPLHLAQQRPEYVDRLFREARLAARIQSPHLVSVIDVNQEEGLFYLVMEFVRGETAAAFLERTKKAGHTGARERDALDICASAAAGLAAAHAEGIIHRDIKPDNILIPKAKQGDGLLFSAVKLADLGLARGEEMAASLTGDHIMGTPGYMAPEQAIDARSARKPADVFGIGATLYALLAGHAPFRGATPMNAVMAAIQQQHEPVRKSRPDVTAATAALVDRCLAKEPQHRFADGAVLLEALNSCRAAIA